MTPWTENSEFTSSDNREGNGGDDKLTEIVVISHQFSQGNCVTDMNLETKMMDRGRRLG